VFLLANHKGLSFKNRDVIKMLYELQRKGFYVIESLLSGGRVNLEVKAIAAGYNPGWVFVDDKNSPQTALVFSRGQGGFYFVGRENNRKFESALLETITSLKPRLTGLGINCFEYSGTSPEWDQTLEQLFAHRDYGRDTQHVYLFPDLNQRRLPALRQGQDHQVVEINRALLNNPGLNTAFIEENLLDWWDSLDQFFKFGGGYGVICAGKAVALCYTSFVAGEKDWELGVNTHEDYRMQGYGMLRLHCWLAAGSAVSGLTGTAWKKIPPPAGWRYVSASPWPSLIMFTISGYRAITEPI
jgi:hypothetical protein